MTREVKEFFNKQKEMNQTKLDELIEKREKEKKDGYRDSYIQDEMLDDLRSLKDQEQEERLLGEDLPYNDDLGCRIYRYVKDGVVNITRVEYTKHIIPLQSEQEVEKQPIEKLSEIRMIPSPFVGEPDIPDERDLKINEIIDRLNLYLK